MMEKSRKAHVAPKFVGLSNEIYLFSFKHYSRGPVAYFRAVDNIDINEESFSSREQWEEIMVGVRKGSLRLGEGELSRNGGLPLEVW